MKMILVGLMCGVAATAASAVDLHIASMAANGRLVEIIDVDSIAREKHVTRVNVISVVHKLGKLFKNPISERWGKQICLRLLAGVGIPSRGWVKVDSDLYASLLR